MTCERCGEEHDGSYASGRFCGPRCSRGFSTSAARAEINHKVSVSMKARVAAGTFVRPPASSAFKGKKHRPESLKLISLGVSAHFDRLWEKTKLRIRADELVTKGILRRFLIELFGVCQGCGNSEWRGFPLVLELHHKDGNSKNHRLSNSELLCPNCHSLTDTYKGRNRKSPYGGMADTPASNSGASACRFKSY